MREAARIELKLNMGADNGLVIDNFCFRSLIYQVQLWNVLLSSYAYWFLLKVLLLLTSNQSYLMQNARNFCFSFHDTRDLSTFVAKFGYFPVLKEECLSYRFFINYIRHFDTERRWSKGKENYLWYKYNQIFRVEEVLIRI